MDPYDLLSHPNALAVFFFTLILPVLVGFLAIKRTQTQSDYLIGGKAMSALVVALSAVSSGRSSWLVLGVSGIAFTRGVSAVWAVVGYVLIELLQFLTIGRRVRHFGERHDIQTLLDYYEHRFPLSRQRIRLFGAVIMVFFMTVYVAAQFSAGAKSLSVAMKWPMTVSLLASVLMVLIYMVLGGYIAVAYNDVVRAFIMIFGLVIFPAFGLWKLGGFSLLIESLKALDPALIDPVSIGFGVMVGYLGIGLGSPGQPHIVVRYLSIKRADHLPKASLLATFWNVTMSWGAIYIGLLGRVFLKGSDALPKGDPELVYLVMASQLFGPILYGLMIGGIFAAILSTADSQLLVVSSIMVRDIGQKLLKRGEDRSEKRKMVYNRLAVIGAGLLAFLLALLVEKVIFVLVLFAWGGLGASFGSTLILSLYWRRTTYQGIIAGMLVGMGVTIVWKLFLFKLTGVYELIPAFFLALLTGYLVSLFSWKGQEAGELREDPL